MNSLRKWFYRPRRDDTSLMAQFYYADEELNLVAGELDSFDGRKDPERCTALVNQLRQAQDKVLNICVEMMEDLLPHERAPRDFRVKFPDDVMQETLSGQLWFGAECLAAGSSILNREAESTKMRPLAKAVTKTIENVRNLIREQCLKPIPEYTEKIRESLKIFDRLFADFELSYVSAMVPVKSVEEHEMQQNVVVLFSDTLQRSVKIGLVTQEQIDNYDPALMFTIPRLAIVAGLVIFPDGPLNVEKESKNMSELFRPFKTLLLKIRELLWTMSPQELATLEKCLCSMEEPDINIQTLQKESSLPASVYEGPVAYTSDFVHRFYTSYPSCRQLTPDMISFCSSGKKIDRNERKRDRNSSKSSRTRARQERQSERFLSRLTGVEERPRARKRSRRGSTQQPTYPQYPEHSPESCPPQLPYPTVDADSGSHFDPMIRQPPPLHPRISPGRPVHHSPYTSSGDRRHSNLSGRHRSRQSCHTRHRADRINTIVCACGTTNGQVPSSPGLLGGSRHMEETLQHTEHHLYPVNDSRYPNSTLCPVYRNLHHLDVSNEHLQTNTYHHLQDFDSSRDISTAVHVESIPDSIELSRSANIQNCVANAVIADPCILFPVSFREQDNTLERNLSPQPQTDYLSSDFNRLSLTEETLNPATINCDDCNNIQSYGCDTTTTTTTTTTTCDTPIEQMVDIVYNLVGEDSVEKPCVCGSKCVEKEVCSSISANVSSGSSPPVPEPRHSHTTLRPYGPKVATLIHSNEDAILIEQKVSKTQVLSHKALQSTYDVDQRAEDEDVGSSGSTSPHHSGPEDDEEVALALQAAEVAASWKARERFANSGDLIQRLFVCISGVADQLQTNYASDLRKILRCVFTMNQTPDEEEVEIVEGKEHLRSRKESGNEDGTSTNGSEQLSVESAEDALAAIGSPETGGRPSSPACPSDEEEDDEGNSLHSDDSRPRSLLRANSVLVPASVFNDHSLMQYSTMSPVRDPLLSPLPPLISDRNYGSAIECVEITSDNETPVNDASFSDVSSGRRSRQDSSQSPNVLLFNLNPISESLGSLPTIVPVSTMIPVATSPSGFVADVLSFDTQSPTPSLDPQESQSRRYSIVQEPPLWIPDNLAPRCMACGALFTVVRRRHHCRNCGKVFCGHCSRHSVPLPHFGIWKNVRVCNACFLYYVTSSADGSSALS